MPEVSEAVKTSIENPSIQIVEAIRNATTPEAALEILRQHDIANLARLQISVANAINNPLTPVVTYKEMGLDSTLTQQAEDDFVDKMQGLSDRLSKYGIGKIVVHSSRDGGREGSINIEETFTEPRFNQSRK